MSNTDIGEPLAYTSFELLCENAIDDTHHPLHEFVTYVEETEESIRTFYEGVQQYEARLSESTMSAEWQAQYEVLQSTMASISGDLRRLRNCAWRLGDKFNGQLLLRRANIVLASFQTTCAFLHSIQARSHRSKQNARAAMMPKRKVLSPIVEVEEPAYDQSTYVTTKCFQYDNRSRAASPLEVDPNGANTVVLSRDGEKIGQTERSLRESLLMIDFGGGPFNKSMFWRPRNLKYIGIAAASVVLVSVVGLITSYTAIATGKP
jgi:hypothetical protein